MRTIKKILVAVKDPEAKSLPAVTKAAQLAQALNAEIELFHAIDTPLYIDILTVSGNGVKQIESSRHTHYLAQLERVAERTRKRGVKVSTAADWDFPSYESVIRHAARIGADLIVAECHGGRHFAPWLLHMSDWELLRLSPVPVLLVKSARPYRRPVVLAAVDPTHAFAKPARLDSAILELGDTLKSALHGTLHAVHAYMPYPVGLSPEVAMSPDVATTIEMKAATRAREGFAHALKSTTLPKTHRHLIREHPVDAIPNVARQIGCAIVVMGAVSRSGLKRVFIGNTAEKVLDQLECDLLVIKPARFVSRVPRRSRGVRMAAATPLP